MVIIMVIFMYVMSSAQCDALYCNAVYLLSYDFITIICKRREFESVSQSRIAASAR